MNLQNVFTKKTVIGAVSALSIALTAPCMLSNAHANPNSFGGGFNGPGPAITSIKDASAMPDDSWVTLRGNIVSHVGGETYMFQDASGQGKIEIDNDVWRGIEVSQNDLVEIVVEVEKEWGFVEFEVEQIRRVN